MSEEQTKNGTSAACGASGLSGELDRLEPGYEVCPRYKSKTYYGVVILTEKYKGWSCVFAGDGALKFQHDNGGVLNFYHGRADNWLESCWDDFLAIADRPNA